MKMHKEITFIYPLEKCKIVYNFKDRFDFYISDDNGTYEYDHSFNIGIHYSFAKDIHKIAENIANEYVLKDDKYKNKLFITNNHGYRLITNRY